jgi:peroxiredoxin/WD40 repeat protein
MYHSLWCGDAHPNFSPDDSSLVYMSEGEIKVVNIASGKVLNLTNSPTADLCPHWSYEKNIIVFDSKRDDKNRELYTMFHDGTNVQRLTYKPDQQDKCPVFSPDGSRITYICTENGDMDIFVMKSDGTGVRNLTNHKASDRCPSWTPDGGKITFMSNRTGTFEVYIMNADDGSHLKQLTDLKIKGSNCWMAAVSPDGKQICFVGDFEGNNELYIIDIDGENLYNLTNHEANEQWPSWSNDGSLIAFTSRRSGTERIYTIRPDGSELTQVTGIDEILNRIRVYDFDSRSGYTGVADINDDAWKVRTLVVRDLLRLDSPAISQIRYHLTDNNRHVRHVCTMVLGLFQAGEALVDLKTILTHDPDPIVRGQAAEALGQLKDSSSVSILKNVSKNDSSKDVRHRAELAISAFENDDIGTEEQVEKFLTLEEKSFNIVQSGKEAPDFSLKDTKGKVWTLSDALKKNEYVVLIWIFADWCGVCQREFYDLIQLEQEFKEVGVAVATIECHDRHRSKIMVAGRKLWWPHLVDAAGSVGAAYGVAPMEFFVHEEWINRPSTIIMDSDGIVKFNYYGTFWGDRPTIDQTLDMIKTGNFEFEHPKRRKQEIVR